MGDLVSLLASAGTGAKRLVQVEFTSSTVWTVPSTVPLVLVTAVGGGGGGCCPQWWPGFYNNSSYAPGGGGAILRRWPMSVKGTVSITVGAGGTGGILQVYNDSVYFSPGGSGGNTVINDIIVGGGGGGYTLTNSWDPQTNFGSIFDSKVFDSYYQQYTFLDLGTHASAMFFGLNITKANGVVTLVSGSNGYAVPGTRIGQGGGNGSGYNRVAGAPGAAGYVMLEYFV